MSIDAVAAATAVICRIKRLRLEGVAHIALKGPALIAAEHSSPLDLFYYLALMQAVGRPDHRFVTAVELVDAERFRPYAAAAVGAAGPWLSPFAGALARVASWIVPPFMRRFDPILVLRQGDDSASRDQCVAWLLAGHLLTIAPGRGDDRDRDANGLRPLTHSIAAIARRFFDAAQEALPVVPLALGVTGQARRASRYVRLGPPWRAMSDREYPALFAPGGRVDPSIKHQAYADFTRQLAARLAELR